MSMHVSEVHLSLDGCRQRQARLLQRLADERLDAALIMDPRHVHYMCGYWRSGRVLTPAALLVHADGSTVLVCPTPDVGEIAVDRAYSYDADRIATLIDAPYAELFRTLQPHLAVLRALGIEETQPSWALDVPELHNISVAMRALRRTKDPDEVAMLAAGIAGCEAAYARARELLRTAVTEIELYAGMFATATVALGESPTEFGNDFQCGGLGSLPRSRQVEPGETAILDVGVVYRGYSSDLCRTFVVGDRPSEGQIAAHQRVLQALAYIEQTVQPGVSCKALYNEVHAMLDGYRGWIFQHHLGHGIGLSAHEAPRLNPHWNDSFQVGDVFTAEPGLYGAELRAGIRIEEDYLVTPTGVQKLSTFSTDLT